MNITWSFPKVYYYNTYRGCENVVYGVVYTISTAVSGVNTQHSGRAIIKIEPFDSTTYIPLEQVTKEHLVNWVLNNSDLTQAQLEFIYNQMETRAYASASSVFEPQVGVSENFV